jgi:hypothetical protein
MFSEKNASLVSEETGQKLLSLLKQFDALIFRKSPFEVSIHLPSKNENVLKSVTIDGTVCKRVNRCDRVADLSYLAMNRRHNLVCVYLRFCQQEGTERKRALLWGSTFPLPNL